MSQEGPGFASFLHSIIRGMTGPGLRRSFQRLNQVAENARWAFSMAWSSHPSLIFGLAAIVLCEGLFPAGMALVMRGLINSVIEATSRRSHELTPLLPWLVLGLGLTILMTLSKLLSQFLTGRLADEVDISVTSKIMSHAAQLDVAFYEDHRNQDIIHRARQDSAHHFSKFIVTALNLFSNLIQIVALLAILVVVEPLIIVVLLPLAIPHLLFQWHTSMKYYRTEYKGATKRRWSGYFVSLLTGRESVPEVKLLGLAPLIIDRLRSIMAEFRDKNRERYLARLTGSSISAVLTTLVVYGLFAHVVYKVLMEGLTVGDVAVFAAAALRLRGALESSVSSSASTFEQTLYISNLREFLNIKPRAQNGSGRNVAPARGEIEFRNVSFTYPGAVAPVLSKISLAIQPGETVALVGKNGTGKTTLVKLLARFYDPTEGDILFDGVDTREWALKDLHDNITFVFQNFNRYEATARENVAYGNWERLRHDRIETERLANEAGAGKLIESLPQGYDTFLGKRFGKHDLSGGQWQQLAVARALARDAKLLILDEPTSNLDAEAEYELFKRFCKLAHGKTTVLISHRFSTVSMADRILVLDDGRIVEAGTHADLIAKKGHYATLYEFQQMQMKRPLPEEARGMNP
jgi:ATP-binding cassette, subfamily B, bacterial